MPNSEDQFLNNRKYHLKLTKFHQNTAETAQIRTTITLPNFLCDMLSVKLTGKLAGESPKEVRAWLQKLADQYQPRPNCSTSQFFQEYVTYAISDTIISEETEKLRNISFDKELGLKSDTKTIPMFD